MNLKKLGQEIKKKKKTVAGILPHSNKPARVPLIAVPSHPVFPGMFIPIVLISDSDMKAIDYAMKGNGIIALFVLNDKFLEKNNNNAQQKLIIDYSKDIYSVGVTGKIIKKLIFQMVVTIYLFQLLIGLNLLKLFLMISFL